MKKPTQEMLLSIQKLKTLWKDRVAQEIEKQIYLTMQKWWMLFHIQKHIRDELDFCINQLIDDHQWIQMMTGEIKEVIDTMTHQKKSKQEIVKALQLLLDDHDTEPKRRDNM